MNLDLAQGGVWRVEGGRTHVFAVPRRGGEQSAPRRYLFTIEAPGVVFGSSAGPGEFGLVAVPLGDCRLTPDPSFWNLPSDSTFEAVDQWVAAWSAAAMRYLISKPPFGERIEAGLARNLAPGSVVTAGRRVIWMKIAAGNGVLFDSETVGGDGLGLFPLAPGSWLRSFDEMRIEPISAEDLAASGALRPAVEAYEALAKRQTAGALRLSQIDELQRLDRRSGRISGDLARVFGDLGRMVGAAAPTRAMPGSNQVWFYAAHAVASRAGMRAQMPTSVREAEADVEVKLDDILTASSLRSRDVHLPDEWYRRSLGDLIGIDAEKGTPVALLEKAGGYEIDRLDGGPREPVDSVNAAKLARQALVLYQPLPDTRVTIAQLANFGMQGCTSDKLVMAAAATVGACASSLPAIGSRTIMQDVIPQQLTDLLIQIGVALVAVAVLRAVCNYVGNIAFARMRMRSSTRLKAAIWDRLLRQPMAFLSRYTAPDLTMRCNTAETIVMSIHQLAQQSTVSIATLAINLVTMFWLSRVGGLAALGLILVYVGAIWLAWWGQKRAFTLGESAEGATSVFVHAITNGMRKIRLAGAEDRAFVKWGERFSRSRMKLINVRRVTNMFLTFGAGFELAALGAVLAMIAVLREDQLPLGVLFGFVVAFTTTMQSLASLGRAVTNVAFQFASIPYCQPILDAVPPKEAQKTNPGRLSGALEANNLHFRYGDGEPVLQGVSFSVAAGEFVAVVGSTGSGKSTLIKLLLGLETPQGGTVFFDQRDLQGMDINLVRRQIGTVLQRPALMPGTLSDNIRGTSNATADEIWAAAAAAGIADDIKAMPMKLHTLVAEGAPGFSGGQVQRIAIARAIVRQPALLLLDEATSALDNSQQAEVTESLARLSCTRIVVAHRLSTIVRADRILVLDKGQIVEQGTYAELVALGGHFSVLVQRQTLDQVQ